MKDGASAMAAGASEKAALVGGAITEGGAKAAEIVVPVVKTAGHVIAEGAEKTGQVAGAVVEVVGELL